MISKSISYLTKKIFLFIKRGLKSTRLFDIILYVKMFLDKNLNRRFTMSFLKKLYSSAFKMQKGNVKPFVILLVLYVLVPAVLDIAAGLLGSLLPNPFNMIFGWIVGVIGILVSLYCLGGIVVAILKFCDVIKNPVDDGEQSKADEVAGKIGGIFDKVVNATTNVVDKVTEKKPTEEATEEKKDEE